MADDVFSSVPRAFLYASARRAARELGVTGRSGGESRRMRKLLDALDRIPAESADVEVAGPWARIAESIREDRPVGDASEESARFHDHLRQIGEAAARELWSGASGGSLLDVGGGTGIYSALWPGIATVVDRPEVLVRVPETVRTIAGDAFDAPLGGPYDVALLCNVLHLYDAASCARLVARVAAVIRPGGRLIVKDLDPNSDDGVWFALNMALYTDGGDVHAPELIVEWMRAAGVAGVAQSRLAAAPSSLVWTGARS